MREISDLNKEAIVGFEVSEQKKMLAIERRMVGGWIGVFGFGKYQWSLNLSI